MGRSDRGVSHGRAAGVNSKLRFELDGGRSPAVGPAGVSPPNQPGDSAGAGIAFEKSQLLELPDDLVHRDGPVGRLLRHHLTDELGGRGGDVSVCRLDEGAAA